MKSPNLNVLVHHLKLIVLKKGHNELLCRTDTDSQSLKNLWFPKETGWGGGFGMEMLSNLAVMIIVQL